MSLVAMVITYPHFLVFQGLGNMRNSHTTFPISVRPMELLMKLATFPFTTSPLMYKSDSACITYDFILGCTLLKILYSAEVYCGPTKGSSSSPSLAGWIANRPQPMKGKLDTFTSQSLFQYENGASFRMDPSHHCSSYTSDRHFCKVLTLADILVGVVVGMEFLEDCVRLRKVVSDVRHAAFTMGLHRAYRIHVHKLLNSATIRRTMLLCSLRTGWLKSLTRIEAVKTGSLLLLRRCF